MAEEVSLARPRAEQAARRAAVMIRVQSVLILLFLVWISEEYDHNQYFQAWAKLHLGVLEFFLNGTLAGFYAGFLIAVSLQRPLPSRATRVLKEEREKLVRWLKNRVLVSRVVTVI